jgi:hypothetical protein
MISKQRELSDLIIWQGFLFCLDKWGQGVNLYPVGKNMLTEEESQFIVYWEKNRIRQKKITRQFLLGMPLGLLFILPILINFGSGWYKRAQMVANSSDFSPGTLMIALLLIFGFIAIFSRKHRWEMNEQRYLELKAREGSGPPPKEIN